LAGLLYCGGIYAQNIDSLYNEAILANRKQNFYNSIDLFSKCLEIDSTKESIWFSRGVVLAKIGNFTASIKDYDKAIALNHNYLKAYYNRGNSKQDIKDYNGAILDYRMVLIMDSNYVDAYWNLAETYEKKLDTLSACLNYRKASSLGDNEALNRLNYYRQNKLINDTSLNLSIPTEDSTYAFTEKNPVYVGSNIYTGPQSQRYFLDQLYDNEGNKIKYERKGACCMYDSKGSALGFGMLDVYLITFMRKGKIMTKNLYISMYDYEKPKIPVGLKIRK
jgi:tetratricopeptide (TPR) repeat protein